MEVFKEIDIQGLIYKVGNNCTIVSPKGRILKTTLSSKGYPLIDVQKIGKKIKVHRLVALLHVPNPDNKPQVNHINGDKTDFRAINLEWVTDSENKRHAFKTGLYKSKKHGFPKAA